MHKFVIGLSALLLLPGIAFAAPCTSAGAIKKIKNTRIGHYEYIVFDIIKPASLTYAASRAEPPFIADPSGNPVTVAGDKFRRIKFSNVFWTCEIAEALVLPKPVIQDIKKLSQFEGIVEYVAGYRNASHYLGTYHYDVSASRRKVVMSFHK